MSTSQPLLLRAYLAALRKHLKQTVSLSQGAARALGTRAVGLGMETLEMARMHEEAVVALMLRDYATATSEAMLRRAGAFFAETITPLEETHQGEPAPEPLAASRLRQEELQHLSRLLLSAQEAERRKISRELHLIARMLTDLHGRLAPSQREAAVGAKSWPRKLADTQRLVQQSVDTVHRFARELRPSVLDDLGLIPALESFIAGSMLGTGMRVNLQAVRGLTVPDSSRRTVLYRVAEEALANVARHARASRAVVRIQKPVGRIRMEITDDGRGFAVNGSVGAPPHHGLGLLGMRERVEMIGGTFHIESAPGRTTVRVDLPNLPKRPLVKKADASLSHS